MSVLDRDALDQSPLADLHAIASELSLDGYRRLRKADLIDAIIERQGGAPASGGGGAASDDEESATPRRRRGRRSARAKDGADEAGANGTAEPDAHADAAQEAPAAAEEPAADDKP
ncbi:MAG: transcription termination factor Rho, partial [Solirubrobacteraceae bacterium]|nr:transcription termination factor Rho [Solirubrobacteraceae bacterium]